LCEVTGIVAAIVSSGWGSWTEASQVCLVMAGLGFGLLLPFLLLAFLNSLYRERLKGLLKVASP
jgi:hypothetical protein